MFNDSKYTAKATQDCPKAKKYNGFKWPSQSPDLSPFQHAFSLTKDKTEDRKTHKQTATEF